MGDARFGATVTMASMQTAPRGRLTSALWILMWLTWLGFVAQQAADVERFSGTWLLIGLRGAPLVFFLWAALTDSMRLFIWFELVLLFYFISAVEAAFAYQADILSIAGLALVVINFTACMLYIRYRGRELRGAL
ncbi:MAG: hypothetical protein CM15mP92_1340 [Halieaceae bacterium]|nr:MAG: hypothetical protein CM15mP92_1340 [Halieaceae bacterium]